MLDADFGELGDSVSCGPKKVAIRSIRFLAGKFMYIDLTIPLRAVYFPIAHQSDEKFTDMCTYLMVDFTHRDPLWIHDLSDRPP